MTTVWVAEENSYEAGAFLGVYATEELAIEAARRRGYPDLTGIWEEEVVTELPPEPVRPPYQVIP